MKRSLLRPRQKAPKRSRIKKHPRSKSERERIYGPKGYVEWIHEQPCVGCGVAGYSEGAHVGRRSGMGRKGSWTETVPLCGPHPDDVIPGLPLMGCHRVSHTFGLASIPEFDAEKAIAETQAAWLSKTGKTE